MFFVSHFGEKHILVYYIHTYKLYKYDILNTDIIIHTFDVNFPLWIIYYRKYFACIVHHHMQTFIEFFDNSIKIFWTFFFSVKIMNYLGSFFHNIIILLIILPLSLNIFVHFFLFRNFQMNLNRNPLLLMLMQWHFADMSWAVV